MTIASAWRDAAEPRGAHTLARQLLSTRRYEHSRGVAQQVARLARLTNQPRDLRRRLLACAWLHDVGYGLGPESAHPLAAARALRLAGHEAMARIVAHHSGSAVAARLDGRPPIADEFPVPTGVDGHLLALLDIADLTTSPTGAAVSPGGRLLEMAERRGVSDIRVRVLVETVERLRQDPALRVLVERVSGNSGALHA